MRYIERVWLDFVLWLDYSDFGRMLVDFVILEVILVDTMSLSFCGHVWCPLCFLDRPMIMMTMMVMTMMVMTMMIVMTMILMLMTMIKMAIFGAPLSLIYLILYLTHTI